MISRVLSLVSFFTKNEVFNNLMEFCLITQTFYPLQLMAYTEYLGLHIMSGCHRSDHI